MMALTRQTYLRTTLLVAIIAAPLSAAAAIQLSPIMQSWHSAARMTQAMLSGRRPYDEATIRGVLRLYMEDATMIAGRIKGNGAAAEDLRSRFAAFTADARVAFAHIGQPSADSADFARLNAECGACHSLYNN
jgi:cytochrome c556